MIQQLPLVAGSPLGTRPLLPWHSKLSGAYRNGIAKWQERLRLERAPELGLLGGKAWPIVQELKEDFLEAVT